MSRVRAAVTVVVGFLAVLATAAGPVAAHAELVSSTPAQGAMLTQLPPAVELVFSENVGVPAALLVVGPDGTELPAGDLEVVDDTVRRGLTADSATAGWYTISYEVTSADGHPITGTISFMLHAAGSTMDTDAAPAPAAPVTDSTGADPLVVGAFVAALAAALAAALLAARRLVRVAEPTTAP